MKYSCFNSIISITKRSALLFNAFSDSFFVFDSNLKKIISDDVDTLQKVNPGLYQKLVESGVYIDSQIDEIERLSIFSRQKLENNSEYFVIINPTLACNYKCWYCYVSQIQGSNMSTDVLNRVFRHIDNILNSNANLKEFPIAFFGGEPLISFKSIVLPIIKYHQHLCTQKGIQTGIAFTSNGGLITKLMVSELVKYKKISFQITLDGGEEEHNKVRFSKKGEGSYQSIINNIKLLLRNNINVRIRINYTVGNVHSLKSIVNDLQDIPVSERNILEVDFHWVWQERKMTEDLHGIRSAVNHFVDNGFKVIFNDIDLIRNSCYGDRKNTAVINYNGDVFKCTAEDFIRENRDGYLDENGDIVWINSQEYRLSLKLKNDKCKTCRIAPLCGGGCSRHLLQQAKKGVSYCILETEDRIDELILDRFDKYVRNNSSHE